MTTNDCPNSVALMHGRNQAFCANTWCMPEGDSTLCKCPVYNGVGLLPSGSLTAYKNQSDTIISTWNVMDGVKQSPGAMCLGKYIDCYGKPCTPNTADQAEAECHCVVREGPFVTMSATCGPDSSGKLPNGAAMADYKNGAAGVSTLASLMETVYQEGRSSVR